MGRLARSALYWCASGPSCRNAWASLHPLGQPNTFWILLARQPLCAAFSADGIVFSAVKGWVNPVIPTGTDTQAAGALRQINLNR